MIDCGEKPANISTTCFKAPNFCLFNIAEDPCEYNDLSDKHPDILNTLNRIRSCCALTLLKKEVVIDRNIQSRAG